MFKYIFFAPEGDRHLDTFRLCVLFGCIPLVVDYENTSKLLPPDFPIPFLKLVSCCFICLQIFTRTMNLLILNHDLFVLHFYQQLNNAINASISGCLGITYSQLIRYDPQSNSLGCLNNCI